MPSFVVLFVLFAVLLGENYESPVAADAETAEFMRPRFPSKNNRIDFGGVPTS